jgi:glutamate racemase
MDNRPIGIFDAGVGGLSVLLEIKELLPNESIIFIADQAYVPYGDKTKDQLLGRVSKIIEFFQNADVKAVVMACNTATVHTLEEMRKKFSLPIVGTVPVVKTLATISKTRVAAVLSTPATNKSAYLDSLINKFAPDMEIVKVGMPNLAGLVETGEIDTHAVKDVLQKELPPLLEKNVDAIALGCTHYPFLRKQIRAVVGPDIKIVDSGGAVARRLHYILEHENILATDKTEDQYYTTGDEVSFKLVAEKLMNVSNLNVQHLEL